MRVDYGRESRGKKGKSRKKGRQQKAAAVQRLFLKSREVFAGATPGAPPSPADVGRIRAVLDAMVPADVDLSPISPIFDKISGDVGVKPVAYLHLYECDDFSIGIFCLPPSAVIPLHNHPGMTVFSKLLFGSMHVKSYDWVDDPQSSKPNSNSAAVHPAERLAKVKADAVFTAPCDTSILYPNSGGNIHCFTALTTCAVLDVLGPPYCDPEGRHCTYFSKHPCSGSYAPAGDRATLDGSKYAWLEEMERPADFYVLGEKYTGPRIVDD